MSKTLRLARTAVAAATLATAGSAFADGTFTPELGFAHTTGKHVLSGDGHGHSDSLAVTGAFGYELDNGFGARLMAIGDFDFAHAFGATEQSFDNFVGVQATGKFALAHTLNLRGGVGVGRTRLADNSPERHEMVTDGVLSLGLQWRPADHFAMELRVDHLTASDTTTVGLQFQVPF